MTQPMPAAIWFGDPTLELIRQLETGTFASYIGVEFTELGHDYLCGRMPVTDHHLQPFGLLHGGASVALAETLGSIAANLVVNREYHYCVGQSITSHHVRPVERGYVAGVARPVHIEQRRQAWEILLRNDDDEVSCISTLVMAVRARPTEK